MLPHCPLPSSLFGCLFGALKDEDPLGAAIAQESKSPASDSDGLDAPTLRLGASDPESEAESEKDCIMEVPRNMHMFESPEAGHSGWPRSHIVEMCMALMQHLASENDPIMR